MKRVLSVLLSLLFLACLFVLPAGASGVNLVKKECPECGLSSFPSKSEQVGMFVVYTFECENGHTYTYKFIPGVTDKGGTTRGGGAGRDDLPSGYTSDGVANYTKDGLLTWHPTLDVDINNDLVFYYNGSYRPGTDGFNKRFTASYSLSSDSITVQVYPVSGKSNFDLYKVYLENVSFIAPITGYYSSSSPYASANFIVSTDSSSTVKSLSSSWSYQKVFYNKGDFITVKQLCFWGWQSASWTMLSYLTSKATTPIFTITPIESVVTNQTNITINNNTWNGNIYQDTENNLTYIYPQYTTINDAGDTITNISENPIIYNSTTNQYYTYDSTTNNYYYITYVTATPEPSASPEPTATPDPGTTPTPTPTPGGDAGDTSGLLDLLRDIKDSIVQGFADLAANIKLTIENLNINIKNYFDTKLPDISTGETATPSPQPSSTPTAAPSATPQPSPDVTATPAPSDSPTSTPSCSPSPLPTLSPTPPPGNSSDTSFTNPFKWLSDLLGDIFNGILKGLFKLFGSIFSFLLWLLSLPGQFVPWLPDGCVTALVAGAVVVTIIRLLKFILGR